jgi:hypothetical protein
LFMELSQFFYSCAHNDNYAAGGKVAGGLLECRMLG